ncbi:DUF4880 domain-containing protein [Sphingomonas koreensis]|uniref:DUF4880 domain-containing protein n=1 Tax=Sphingomonas koreensis TaxID=93064 RepID=A0A430G029_9SPHN|nr:FecR domain-containing protein [Sphingomonas koreensis]RSY79356.1 DUF4880 domain-containing protein [Sphingomonas koreensis]
MMGPADELAAREAAEWHARLQTRSVSNSDLDQFYEWRSDPVNARAFEAIDAVWDRASKLADDPRISRAIQDVGRKEPKPSGIWATLTRAKMVSAGVLAAIAIAITSVYLFTRPTTYSTGVGETLVVLLDDGSRVTLNTASKISVRLSSHERIIDLEGGQALFEVAHDAARPFAVIAGEAKVTALGTQFEVRRSSDLIQVTLVEGRIAVSPGADAKLTKLAVPGATLAARGSRVELARVDTRAALGWTTGKIDLREQPMSAAIEEVNRYSRGKVVLDDPAQAATKVSGVFATGDRRAFTAAVTTLLPLSEFEAPDGTIHLKRKIGRGEAGGTEMR